MFTKKKCPKKLLNDVVLIATYLINHMPSKALKMKILQKLLI